MVLRSNVGVQSISSNVRRLNPGPQLNPGPKLQKLIGFTRHPNCQGIPCACPSADLPAPDTLALTMAAVRHMPATHACRRMARQVGRARLPIGVLCRLLIGASYRQWRANRTVYGFRAQGLAALVAPMGLALLLPPAVRLPGRLRPQGLRAIGPLGGYTLFCALCAGPPPGLAPVRLGPPLGSRVRWFCGAGFPPAL